MNLIYLLSVDGDCTVVLLVSGERLSDRLVDFPIAEGGLLPRQGSRFSKSHHSQLTVHIVKNKVLKSQWGVLSLTHFMCSLILIVRFS